LVGDGNYHSLHSGKLSLHRPALRKLCAKLCGRGKLHR
jgi:hypothetical protein